MLIDSHCHLQDKKFRDVPDVVERARSAGVTAMVTIGYDMPSSRRAIEIAGEYEDVYATVGVHPHDAKDLTPRDLDELARMTDSPKVVGIGEIGLDFFRNLSPQDEQYRAFRDQLALARNAQLPVIIHSRDADDEAFAVLEEYARETQPTWAADKPIGVMHCYAGDLALAKRYIDIGFVISIAGPVTYPAAERTREVARSITLERMTLETDSPYLPPQSMRGKRNEPAFVRDVAEFVAELRGDSLRAVSEATASTASWVFGLGVTAGEAR